MNIAYNMDCMDGMRQYPDKYFDLEEKRLAEYTAKLRIDGL